MMKNFKLQLDNPDLDEGAEVEIPLLGVFVNGKVNDINPDQLNAFLISTGQKLEDVAWPIGFKLLVQTPKAPDKSSNKEGSK